MSSDFVLTPGGFRANLYSADEVRALNPGGTNDLLIETVDWCEHFLGRPSSLVGRTGNVCPFVPQAMMLGSLKFSVISLKNRGENAMTEIEEIVTAFREHFLANEKAHGKIDIFGSWVMIFPDITAEEASRVIDVPQRQLKPSFVREGLMLGEFHPISRSPGLRNSAFRPLRSPIPLLVIRHMVESDIDFLSRPFDPPLIRTQSLKSYLQFLGSSLSVASQVKAKEALKIAEADLSSETERREPSAC
ncbi:hypothetical protein ACPOL_2472 [Acidisarcina polymorpha]|uniref:DUF6875 domain-containing protein n=1 Tax=Acidisarcina polymorpha TaxID=2211140 RepID=A0A2Z5FZ32_9BACT|nr:hypothetical protein [Acidisarcina polymorpha]AXC11794.1 hypothetical protein ACPOL_2472 [Acidisarcina polymorpha]